MRRWLFPLLLLSACGGQEDEGPIRVGVIGGPPTLVDPNRKAPDMTQRVMLGAVAEGLVTFDEAGQIAPALAQRWIVTSDGLSAIFRLRRVSRPDGQAITSQAVARRVRAMFAPASRNPLRSAFDSIDEIDPTTPEVIDFRLTTPRPPLLVLLAQPEAVLLSRTMASTGPFKATAREGDTVTLEPRVQEKSVGPREVPSYGVRLTGERAARAIAAFAADERDLVLGGTFLDWPLLQFADLPNNRVRIDPAEGLFGLSVQNSEGFLAIPENRQALAMAIDRDAILNAFGAPGWVGVLTVLPRRYRSAADPAFPPWAVFDITGRVQEARRRVAAWRETHDEPLRVRLHLPDGPGSTLLFGRLAADWRRIGIETERTSARDADLKLIDLVAPAGSALWYLDKVACPARAACSESARDALAAARTSRSLQERGAQLALADQAVATSAFYIPLARPLRWSLVSPGLTLFRENSQAWHPLTHLRRDRR